MFCFAPRHRASRSTRHLRDGAFFYALLGAPSVALGQVPDARPYEIVVTAPTRYGSLAGAVPERSISAEEAGSYGLNTIGELADEIATQSGEDAAGVVILINGVPVRSRAAIADLPVGALSRLEVLAPGTGTRVGASAHDRVFNVVLKKTYQALALTATGKIATGGGWAGHGEGATFTRIRGNDRLNITARTGSEGRLMESERAIIQPAGLLPSVGDFRSLKPSARSSELSLTAAKGILPWLEFDLNGRLGLQSTAGLLGLPPSMPLGTGPLQRRNRNTNGSIDASLNATTGAWLLSATARADGGRRRTLTDRDAGVHAAFELDRVVAITRSMGAQFTASGPLLRLPAGSLTLASEANVSRFVQEGQLEGAAVRAFRRTEKSLRGELTIPLTSRTEDFFRALGDLSLSLEATRSKLSDREAFTKWNSVLNWIPARWLRLSAGRSVEQRPPNFQELRDPDVVSPNIRTFDFLNARTVDVVQVTGGNPDLKTERESGEFVNASIKPFRIGDLRVDLGWNSKRVSNLIAALPPASLAILEAFPDRFQRDSSGALVRADIRATNFDRQLSDQVRYGLSFSQLLGERSLVPASPESRPRLQFSLTHSIQLQNKISIRPGLPTLDLLRGSAVGGTSTSARHLVSLGVGVAKGSNGVRLTGVWRSGNQLAVAQNGPLQLGSLGTFNLLAFANLAPLSPKLLHATRIRLVATNIADARQRVRLADGSTPLQFQPAYRDPLGRTIELELRKEF